MLNLNYNLVGAAGKQNRDINGFAAYPRNDEFSSSLVLAIPGTVFYQDYQPLFGATKPYDDISSYIKYGTTTNNMTSTITGSGYLSGSNEVIGAQFVAAGYSDSLKSSGTVAALFQSTGSYQGLNLTTGSAGPYAFASKPTGWVFESWIAFPISASMALYPSRLAVSQPVQRTLPFGKDVFSYLWWPGWSGDTNTGAEVENVSGSSFFLKREGSNTEFLPFPGTSNYPTAYVWKHWAVSYSDPIVNSSPYNSTGVIRQYIDGELIASGAVDAQFVSTTNPAQLFGAVAVDGDLNPWNNGVDVYYQDFRFYSGSNKNYTGSNFPVPEPMIVGRPY